MGGNSSFTVKLTTGPLTLHPTLARQALREWSVHCKTCFPSPLSPPRADSARTPPSPPPHSTASQDTPPSSSPPHSCRNSPIIYHLLLFFSEMRPWRNSSLSVNNMYCAPVMCQIWPSAGNTFSDNADRVSASQNLESLGKTPTARKS